MVKLALKSRLRSAAIRYSKVPGVNLLLSACYSFAIFISVRTLRRNPNVLALYVREKAQSPGYRPGLSDIDLTVALANSDDADQLSVVWTQYLKLKRFLPMLGELEVHDQTELEEVFRSGPAAWNSIKVYRPLFPERLPLKSTRERYTAIPAPRTIQRDAMVRYLRYFGPASMKHFSSAKRLDAELYFHAAEQLWQRFERASVPQNVSDGEPRFLSIFRKLEAIPILEGGISPKVYPQRQLDTPSELQAFVSCCLEELPALLRNHLSVVAWNAFGIHQKCSLAFIFSDDFPIRTGLPLLFAILGTQLNEARRTLENILADFPIAGPMVLSADGWKSMMNLLPFEQAEMESGGVLLHGAMPPLAPLNSQSATDYVRSEYPSLLTMKNAWRGAARESLSSFYRELNDQITIYLRFLDSNEIGCDCTLQRLHSPNSFPETHRLFCRRLTQLGEVLRSSPPTEDKLQTNAESSPNTPPAYAFQPY